jgi:hypothetical protein
MAITIREAAEQWVSQMDHIETAMIDKLMQYEPWAWHEVTVRDDDEDDEDEDYGFLPCWGTMFSFRDSADIDWMDGGYGIWEEQAGIKALSKCGFHVYESDEFGYFFGIDAAGFDFYEAFWIPLYKARGLQWHDIDEED